MSTYIQVTNAVDEPIRSHCESPVGLLRRCAILYSLPSLRKTRADTVSASAQIVLEQRFTADPKL
jgi:hypothetical protein